MRVSPNIIYLSAFLIVTLVASCDSTKVYQEFSDFDESFWHQDSVVRFQFSIEDASQPYNLLALFRNSQHYPYHNMYYKYSLRNDADSVLSEEQMKIFFFDPKTGEPYGSGVGELFDNEQTVLESYTFPEVGDYSVLLTQYMRLDSLPFILSAGWRVETIED